MKIVLTKHSLERLERNGLWTKLDTSPQAFITRVYMEGIKPPKGFEPRHAKRPAGAFTYKLFLGFMFVFVILGQTASLVTVYKSRYKRP